MNTEIQQHEILTYRSHAFTFMQPVKKFIVGFSNVNLRFPSDDHHIAKIKIDLTNTDKAGNTVTITPKLKMVDRHGSPQSNDSSINVVIVAQTGDGNSSIHMQKGLQVNREYPFAWDNNIFFFNSAMSYTKIKFPKNEDHHIQKYQSSIEPTHINQGPIILTGNATANDTSCNVANGEVKANVFCYYDSNHNILSSIFSSYPNREQGEVNLGQMAEGSRVGDYQIACFINKFNLSFGNKDHHIKQIELLSEIQNPHERHRNLIVTLNLRAHLNDKKNWSNIAVSRNEVSGFILAINRYPRNEITETLSDFIRSYNQISSQLRRRI